MKIQKKYKWRKYLENKKSNQNEKFLFKSHSKILDSIFN